jgi:hypothetical protein
METHFFPKFTRYITNRTLWEVIWAGRKLVDALVGPQKLWPWTMFGCFANFHVHLSKNCKGFKKTMDTESYSGLSPTRIRCPFRGRPRCRPGNLIFVGPFRYISCSLCSFLINGRENWQNSQTWSTARGFVDPGARPQTFFQLKLLLKESS